MEILTFFAVCITVVPLQIMLMYCLLWFKRKFDKYETIAVGVIDRYFESINEVNHQVLKYTPTPNLTKPARGGMKLLDTVCTECNDLVTLSANDPIIGTALDLIAYALGSDSN